MFVYDNFLSSYQKFVLAFSGLGSWRLCKPIIVDEGAPVK